jgi:surfeit locus 1 family protein
VAQTRLDAQRRDAPISLPPATPIAIDEASALQFRPLALSGRFLPEKQFLLDNQVHRDQVGYRVITPFVLAGGPTVVLVDRGWIPAGPSREQLPPIETPTAPLSLSGIAMTAPARFFSLNDQGNTPPWLSTSSPPPVWQHLDISAFARQSGLPTHALVLRLDPSSAHGFVREWPRPDARAPRHYSYALQWFGFAFATLAIGAFQLFRRRSP